ncbi:hypothetical protein SAMN02745885_01667 [Carboxydocella sporoproducens DSM 16521]|uniref:Haemolysin XhlA n=2 Tax=Carboxydocella TaxID=178898 RepID=A0A1T4QGB1_9FIRM|nr:MULTISPECIES: hypothetical protein [Carboxydocella]AVX21584.1 hypothetical protein CFE_2441 [Carboxydocella thermautotrophica]SKA02775.1 hypothetical protein SAMN02745885_01667 [Carboxydocella sporoproducens DSM 16521]
MSDQEIRQITDRLNEISQRMARIEERLSIVPLCGSDCARGKAAELERRLVILEQDKSWIYKTIIGAVIGAFLALILKGGV